MYCFLFTLVAGNKFAALFLLHVDSGNVSQLPLNIKRRYPTSNGRVIEPLVLSNFSASALSLSSVYIQTGCKILEAQCAFVAKVLKFDILSNYFTKKENYPQSTSQHSFHFKNGNEMEMVGGEISFWHKWNSSKKSERVIDACFDAFIQCNPINCIYSLFCAEMQKALNTVKKYLFFFTSCVLAVFTLILGVLRSFWR